MIKRYTVVGDYMRLSGFVTVNGVRMPIDWTITGTTGSSGPGLPANDVQVHVPLPDYLNSSGTAGVSEATVSDNPTGGYWDMTVTDLRLLLKEQNLPIYGNKKDLVERLEGSASTNPTEETTTEEIVEEIVEDGEVNEDAESTPTE